MALQHLASLGIASIVVFILRGSKSGPDPIWKHDHNGMGMRKDRNTKRKTRQEKRVYVHTRVRVMCSKRSVHGRPAVLTSCICCW